MTFSRFSIALLLGVTLALLLSRLLLLAQLSYETIMGGAYYIIIAIIGAGLVYCVRAGSEWDRR